MRFLRHHKVSASIAALLFIGIIIAGQIAGLKGRGILEQIAFSISNEHTVKFDLTHYANGIFGAHANTKVSLISLEIPTPLAERFEISLNHQIQYGPVLFSRRGVTLGAARILTTIEIPDEFQNTITTLLPLDQGLSIETLVYLGGESRTNIYSESQKITLSPLFGDFVWNGLSATVHISEDGNAIIANAYGSGGSTSGGIFNVSLSPFQYSSNSVRTPDGLWMGTDVGFMETLHIAIDGLDVPLLHISNIEVKTFSEYEGQLLTGTNTVEAGRIAIQDMEISDISLLLSVENIHVKSLIESQQTINARLAEIMGTAAVDSTPEEKQIDPMRNLETPDSMALFSRSSPRISLDRFSLSFPFGSLSIEGSGLLHPFENDSSLLNDEIASSFEGSLVTIIDKPVLVYMWNDFLVKRIKSVTPGLIIGPELEHEILTGAFNQVNTFIEAGLLTDIGGDRFESILQYKDGAMNLNGIGLPELLGSFQSF